MPILTEPHRTALILIPLIDALDEVEADSDGLLLGYGLDREKIRAVQLRLPATLVNELFFEAETMACDPTIGVRAGLSIRRGVLDLFDYALRSAATLGEAWAFAAQFDALVDDVIKRTLRVEGERATVEYHRDPREPDVFAEFALTAVGTLARQVTGQLLTARRVTFRRTLARGDDSARFETMLGQAAEFGAPVEALEFPASYLELPLRSSDAGLHRILERHAAELIDRLPKPQSLRHRVGELILGELRGGNPGIVCIAEKMETSARTLRRRLAAEGTTYQALVDELRKSLAQRYLSEGVQVSEVAVLLGFSHASGFDRAFRRWYGRSPLQHTGR